MDALNFTRTKSYLTSDSELSVADSITLNDDVLNKNLLKCLTALAKRILKVHNEIEESIAKDTITTIKQEDGFTIDITEHSITNVQSDDSVMLNAGSLLKLHISELENLYRKQNKYFDFELTQSQINFDDIFDEIPSVTLRNLTGFTLQLIEQINVLILLYKNEWNVEKARETKRKLLKLYKKIRKNSRRKTFDYNISFDFIAERDSLCLHLYHLMKSIKRLKKYWKLYIAKININLEKCIQEKPINSKQKEICEQNKNQELHIKDENEVTNKTDVLISPKLNKNQDLHKKENKVGNKTDILINSKQNSENKFEQLKVNSPVKNSNKNKITTDKCLEGSGKKNPEHQIEYTTVKTNILTNIKSSKIGKDDLNLDQNTLVKVAKKRKITNEEVVEEAKGKKTSEYQTECSTTVTDILTNNKSPKIYENKINLQQNSLVKAVKKRKITDENVPDESKEKKQQKPTENKNEYMGTKSGVLTTNKNVEIKENKLISEQNSLMKIVKKGNVIVGTLLETSKRKKQKENQVECTTTKNTKKKSKIDDKVSKLSKGKKRKKILKDQIDDLTTDKSLETDDNRLNLKQNVAAKIIKKKHKTVVDDTNEFCKEKKQSKKLSNKKTLVNSTFKSPKTNSETANLSLCGNWDIEFTDYSNIYSDFEDENYDYDTDVPSTSKGVKRSKRKKLTFSGHNWTIESLIPDEAEIDTMSDAEEQLNNTTDKEHCESNETVTLKKGKKRKEKNSNHSLLPKLRINEYSASVKRPIIDDTFSTLGEKEKLSYLTELAEAHKILVTEAAKKLEGIHIAVTWPVCDLHKIETRISYPLPAQHATLKTLGAKFGPFTLEDDKTILRNWENFCETHDLENDPLPFLKLSRNTLRYFTKEDRIKFAQYLGRGLPDRPLYTIYRRFKVIFRATINGRFTKEEDDFILKRIEETKHKFDRFAALAPCLNRSKIAVLKRYRVLKANKAPVQWTLETNQELLNHLKDVLQLESVDELQHAVINDEVFNSVSEKMNIEAPKIKQHWYYRVYSQLFAPKNISLYEFHFKIINIFCKLKLKDWKCINWNKVLPYFEGFSKQFVWFNAKCLVRKYVPEEIRYNLGVSMKYLKQRFIRELLKKHKIRRFQMGPDGTLEQPK